MLGDIIVMNRKKGGWFSSCQRFFTGMPYTHSTFSIGTVLGHEYILSADEKIEIIPLDRYYKEKDIDLEIYRLKTDLISNAVMQKMADSNLPALVYQTSGEYYGYLQVTWFVYRWFTELFNADVRKKNNPFKKGIICSELVYMYLWQLYLINPEYFSCLASILRLYTPDTVHAGDIANILQFSQNNFELVSEFHS